MALRRLTATGAETLAQKASSPEEERSEYVAALRAEREQLAARDLPERVANVDAELERLGATGDGAVDGTRPKARFRSR